MKFLIQLPLQTPYAPATIRRGALVFQRSEQFGRLHLLNGRELTAEEVNEVADNVFRGVSWPTKLQPSIRVVVDSVESDTAPAESEADEMTEGQKEWILAAAEKILAEQRKPKPKKPEAETPVDAGADEATGETVETPVEAGETEAPVETEASAKPAKRGRPPKPAKP